jgi:hypothetical protein
LAHKNEQRAAGSGDNRPRIVAVSSRLVLVNGLGSMLGPIVGTSLMKRFENNGVFYASRSQ